MKHFAASVLLFCFLCSPSSAQTFSDYDSYCRAIARGSDATLMARKSGMSRKELEDNMQGMTDPLSIRLVRESIDFAFSQPATASISEMISKLTELCLAKKIFVQ